MSENTLKQESCYFLTYSSKKRKYIKTSIVNTTHIIIELIVNTLNHVAVETWKALVNKIPLLVWLLDLTLSSIHTYNTHTNTLSTYLSMYLSVYLYLSIDLYIYLSMYLSLCPSCYIFLSTYVSVILSLCLSMSLSMCLSSYIYLSIYVSIFLSLYHLCFFPVNSHNN
jgi:hypothetical protein